MRKIKAYNKVLAIPACYDSKTTEQILMMPVEVIVSTDQGMKRDVLESLEYAISKYPQIVSGGAMRGVVNGVDALRFEDVESYRRLSA